MALLSRYTILLSHFLLLHHGFKSTTVQNSSMQSRLSQEPHPNGDNVLEQCLLAVTHCLFHAGITLLQSAKNPKMSSSWMQSRAARLLFFLGIQMLLDAPPSHQMGYCLYLEVMIQLSNSGMCRLVGLSRHFVATQTGCCLFPSHQTLL